MRYIPCLPGKHPINPVNRESFDIDRSTYWKKSDQSEIEKEDSESLAFLQAVDKNMISNDLVCFFKAKGWWYDDESTEYKTELEKLNVDLDSDFSQFYMHVEDGPTFIGRGKEIYHICWFSKNTDFDIAIKSTHEVLGLPREYIPLDSFEGENGYFYNRKTEEVVGLSVGQELLDFKSGKLIPQWKNFNDFLEYYFDMALNRSF